MAEYARSLHKGDVVVVDGGFTCLPDKDRREVKEQGGHLYIECRCGRHYLDANLHRGEYVGLYHAE